jgi:hypothetical protein
MLKTKAEKRNAILRSQIEVACDGASAWLDEQASLIKEECTNLPLGVIRGQLTRGQPDVIAALRMLSNGD